MTTAAPQPISRDDLVAQLRALGLAAGSTVVVHTAFRALAPIEGGPDGLIDALVAVLGRHGTLVMPSMSDDDETPFDAARTPCAQMGVVADTFWRRPGVVRADSPHAFAALGPAAIEICAPQPLSPPHGPDSPVGRVMRMDGWVLMLGVDHSSDTTVHLAEALARVPYAVTKHATVRDGAVVRRLEYEETDHCCARFALVGDWLDERGHQRTGPVGHGIGRLARSRHVVEVALDRLSKDPLVFLHGPADGCRECNLARASIGRRSG